MQRMGMMIGVQPEMLAKYRELHAAVWPEILDLISRCNIRNYTIFLREPENLLFGTWEYHGTDFAADMARMAADEKNQEWWAFTIPCQKPLETRAEGEWWAMMEEVFHHD
ncbi:MULTISPECIES: L-rhamnose mutarotase [Rhizobium/Agrobacterium group]|jgi:L-rhamnose mutarotase|uniref:L-rhamnose mutarotase n=1 Tax=Rhizobium soli TaxID=424798 RepID=A0A7X0JMK1_9HYPH|nr:MULTISPECIES: L-rhamnose mutarotase [Rhizobium/Agrobacterium group]MBB6509814.1 L-rhamnose mutarotase [Rhizobium soli]NSY19453.1 L-rhamnose mutarotase [Neorhizobium sp. AL 9.2.2]RYE61365.1 MAG: L-rhamnose mutarotase [Rhizobiaceae bacterium]